MSPPAPAIALLLGSTSAMMGVSFASEQGGTCSEDSCDSGEREVAASLLQRHARHDLVEVVSLPGLSSHSMDRGASPVPCMLGASYNLTGCSNRNEIKLDEPLHGLTEEACIDSCAKADGCVHANYKMADCSEDGAARPMSCYLLGPGCHREDTSCWNLHARDNGKVSTASASASSSSMRSLAARLRQKVTDSPVQVGSASGHDPFFSIIMLMLACLPIELVLLAHFCHRWRSWWHDDDTGTSYLPQSGECGNGSLLDWLLESLPKILRPYMFGSACGDFWQHCGLLAILLCATVYIEMQYIQWEKGWWDAVEQKDEKVMAVACASFLLMMSAWTATEVFSSYSRGMFAWQWREFQTRRLVNWWTSKNIHYIMQLKSEANHDGEDVDNPDQRIQEDVDHCVSNLIELTWDLLNHVMHFVCFACVVYARAPANMFGVLRLKGWVLYVFIIYAMLGSWISQTVGRAIVSISSELEKREADLRKSLLRISENGESIAVYGASKVEEGKVVWNLVRVRSIVLAHLARSTALSAISTPYSYLNWMLPVFVLIPSYFQNDISMGDLFLLSTALGHVTSSLDWFVTSYESIAEWRTSTERMLQLENALESAESEWSKAQVSINTSSDRCAERGCTSIAGRSPEVRVPEASTSELPAAGVSINVHDIALPTGEALWSRLHLQFSGRQKVLLSGGEGQGKSTLFKVLAGVWPYVGKGEIIMPSPDVLFVPQKPVLPRRCSLRAAMSYPDPPGTYSDEALLRAIAEVGLQRLLQPPINGMHKVESSSAESVGDNPKDMMEDDEGEDEDEDWEMEDEDEEEVVEYSDEALGGGLSRECNWMLRLSPGMQQRLIFAHAILRQPMVLFLDEAACHVAKSSMKELYRSLFRNLPWDALVVTISHDVHSMEDLHDSHYTIRGQGSRKRFHLAKHKDIFPQPGRFAVVLQDNDEWDEVLLCALLPEKENYWLGCTTNDDGTEFKWLTVELMAGEFFLALEAGRSRFVSALQDDEINWICTPPESLRLWTPSPQHLEVLRTQAEDLRQQLALAPARELQEVLRHAPPPRMDSGGVDLAQPGSSALLQRVDEWKEVLLCTPVDGNDSTWICYTTDQLGSTFFWTAVSLSPSSRHLVDDWSPTRKGPSCLPPEMISWMCRPPDCEDLWCPSRDEIDELVEESKQILSCLGVDACVRVANQHDELCSLKSTC